MKPSSMWPIWAPAPGQKKKSLPHVSIRTKDKQTFKIGDTITVKEEVECYYYNYPKGKNKVKFMPGDTAKLLAFPPKVRDYSKDGFTVFAMFDAKGERFGTSILNLKKV